MNQKGIAPWIIVVIVAIVAVCVGLSVYVVTRGGAGPSGLPVYPGAVENIEGAALAKAGLENMGASAIEVSAYTSTQDVTTIASWYRFKMIELGWTKENDDVVSSSGGLMFERGNDGAFIFLSGGPGKTYLVLLYGPFGSIQQLADYLSGLSGAGGHGAPPSAMLTVTAHASGSVVTITISHEGGDDMIISDLEVQGSNTSGVMQIATLSPSSGTFSVGYTLTATYTYGPSPTGKMITVYIINTPSQQKLFSSSGVVVQ
jgi:hypothetical protein